jgi:hypothetical protein
MVEGLIDYAELVLKVKADGGEAHGRVGADRFGNVDGGDSGPIGSKQLFIRSKPLEILNRFFLMLVNVLLQVLLFAMPYIHCGRRV